MHGQWDVWRHLQAQGLQLHGVGGGQGRQQAALVREVLHDALALELRPRARVAQRDAHANLGRIDGALADQHAPCTQRPSQSGQNGLIPNTTSELFGLDTL